MPATTLSEDVKFDAMFDALEARYRAEHERVFDESNAARARGDLKAMRALTERKIALQSLSFALEELEQKRILETPIAEELNKIAKMSKKAKRAGEKIARIDTALSTLAEGIGVLSKLIALVK